MSEQKSTLRKNFPINLVGFINQSIIDQLAPFFSSIVTELSSLVDVSSLDGISFVINDDEYLKTLRQFKDELAPSNDEGVGVAMTISSINGDFSKNHIVINCMYFELENLLEEYEQHTSDEIKKIVINRFAHTLFHEMCHVWNNSVMYEKFPEFAIKQRFPNKLIAMEHGISRICWDEFIVCSEANQIGEDQELNYEEILFKVLDSFEVNKWTIFKDYLNGVSLGDQDSYINLFNNTYMLIHSLLKYAAYYLGDIYTKEDGKVSSRIKKHELYPYVKQLKKICKNIIKELNTDSATEDNFLEIGKLASNIAKENGLIVEVTGDRGLFINLDRTTQAKIIYGG